MSSSLQVVHSLSLYFTDKTASSKLPLYQSPGAAWTESAQRYKHTTMLSPTRALSTGKFVTERMFRRKVLHQVKRWKREQSNLNTHTHRQTLINSGGNKNLIACLLQTLTTRLERETLCAASVTTDADVS